MKYMSWTAAALSLIFTVVCPKHLCAQELVVYLSFENDSADDQSGYNNHGTLVGAGAQFASGMIGRGVECEANGIAGHVSVPDSPSLDALGTQFTISGWFKIETPRNDPHDTLISKTYNWELPGQAFLVATGHGSTVIPFGGTKKNYETQWRDWGAHNWEHIAVVYDNTTAIVYGAGVRTGIADIDPASTNDLPLRVCAYGGNQLDGFVDEIRIFQGLLSDEDIKAEYDRAFDTTAPVVSLLSHSGITQTGAVVSWETDEQASTVLEYATASDFSNAQSTAKKDFAKFHSISLSGLSINTQYFYRVRMTNRRGLESVTQGAAAFTTGGSGDSTPPAAPYNLRVATGP